MSEAHHYTHLRLVSCDMLLECDVVALLTIRARCQQRHWQHQQPQPQQPLQGQVNGLKRKVHRQVQEELVLDAPSGSLQAVPGQCSVTGAPSPPLRQLQVGGAKEGVRRAAREAARQVAGVQ